MKYCCWDYISEDRIEIEASSMEEAAEKYAHLKHDHDGTSFKEGGMVHVSSKGFDSKQFRIDATWDPTFCAREVW